MPPVMLAATRPAPRASRPALRAPRPAPQPAGPVMPAAASWPALGTLAALAVTSPELLPAARGLLTAEIAALDATCSSFRADSEITAVNAAARRHGGPVRVSPLLAEAIGAALLAAAQTGGDVDPVAGPGILRVPACATAGQAGDPDPASPGRGPASAAGRRPAGRPS